MTTTPGFGRSFRLLLVTALVAVFHLASVWGQSVTGTIEGRVTNPSTGGVVERAHITIEGTNLEAFSDSDGYYRLGGVPAGTARVRAFFTGFPSTTASVAVTAAQSTQQDFQ